jgi:hypothetical protein
MCLYYDFVPKSVVRFSVFVFASVSLLIYTTWSLLRAQTVWEMHSGVWWGILKERDHFVEIGIPHRTILKWILIE